MVQTYRENYPCFNSYVFKTDRFRPVVTNPQTYSLWFAINFYNETKYLENRNNKNKYNYLLVFMSLFNYIYILLHIGKTPL